MLAHYLSGAKRGESAMDYETAAECYFEIRGNRPYSADAIQLLKREIQESTALSSKERRLLTKALQKADYERVKAILMRHEEFRKELGRIVKELLIGKRT